MTSCCAAATRHEPLAPCDEQQRIACVRSGDTAAFEQVFRTHEEELRSYAFRFLHSNAAAEDVVFEVFASLWEDRTRFAKSGSISRFLFRAVRNRAISALRRQIVEQRWQDAHLFSDTAAAASDEADREARAEALRSVVNEVLASLPERCRVAAILRWQRQMSYAEIAETMGIAVKTVETYLLRASKALRQRYRARFPEGDE